MILKKHFTSILICASLFLGYHGAAFAQIQKGLDIDGEAANDQSGFSVSMPDANTIAIGARYNDDNGNNAGQVGIYSWNGSTWVQKGMNINGEAANDYSGFSVSMPDSNTVAIGAPFNDGNGNLSGHVRIYTWNGSVWVQKGIDIDGGAEFDLLGVSVSMPDANTVAVGAPLHNEDRGYVSIYIWNGNSWMQKGINIIGEAGGDGSGGSISMPDANTVAIGASGNDENGFSSGHVRVYSWNGSAWVQKGFDIDGEEFTGSGHSVSMPDNNTVAIGAPYDSGYVRIYTWNGSDWVQKGIDIDGQAPNDHSGHSVSMPDNNTIAIGARASNGSGMLAGQVRVFKWNGSSWQQIGNDIDGEAADDQSGCSVSMPDAEIVGIGANLNDGNATDAGHVRVYSMCGTTNSINPTACLSYTSPSGNYTWTSSGTYTDIIPNTVGCDSVITVNLTISNTLSNINPTACSNYTSPSGNYTWTSSGTYMDTIPNVVGCDSVITVNLSINSIDASISNSSPNLISNAFGASYQWLDCNDAMAIIDGETNQNFTATSNGNYAVQVNQNGCMDTSLCEIVNNVGIMTLNYAYGFEVYPNPSNGSFTVFIKNGISGKLNIVDLLGRIHQSFDINKQTINYAVKNIPKGIYFVELVMSNGRKEIKRIEVI